MLDAIKIGLALYIVNFVLGLVSGFITGLPEFSEENTAGLASDRVHRTYSYAC